MTWPAKVGRVEKVGGTRKLGGVGLERRDFNQKKQIVEMSWGVREHKFLEIEQNSNIEL